MFTIPDGRVLAANPAACQILGRTEAEIRALGRQGLADGSDERWGSMLAEREETGAVRGVARMARGDGELIEVEISAKVFRTVAGEARACTIIRDVTDRVRIERELRQSRERLAEAERVAQSGSWEWEIARDRVSWSDGLFHFYGLTPEEFDPTLSGGLQRVYPADRERARAMLERAVADRSSFVLEYRALRKDGRVRTLRVRAEVVVDAHGEPVRVVGIARDVTEAGRAGDESPPAPRHAPLTPRQLEILRLIADGLTSGQIAQQLFVTEATVKWHVKQILTKTASSNRAEAVARVLSGSR